MLKNLANLIKVKTIVTFLILAVFTILALRGVIDPVYVKDLTMIVVCFYFGTQKVDERSGEK